MGKKQHVISMTVAVMPHQEGQPIRIISTGDISDQPPKDGHVQIVHLSDGKGVPVVPSEVYIDLGNKMIRHGLQRAAQEDREKAAKKKARLPKKKAKKKAPTKKVTKKKPGVKKPKMAAKKKTLAKKK